jgi:uncharacterized membrane protein YoaK (UPF0700 family)
MLRHVGDKRNFKHDLRLAILLCSNAGFINAAGFLAFGVLTTNVTGHAALMAVNVAEFNLRVARMAALWLVLFLLGAFCSGFIISRVGRYKSSAYTIPIIAIMGIVVSVAIFGSGYTRAIHQTEYFAGSLLFAMGMQNALVSMISGSVVRTTHLTGMFTDLGIDLSAVATKAATRTTKNRIVLRLTIISFFLVGGIAGGFIFLWLGFKSFFIPAGILAIALFYDRLRIRFARALRK